MNKMTPGYYLLGSIIGDISGSIYEFHNIRTTDFKLKNPESHFTDDTVLTIAIADALLHNKDYTSYVRNWGQKYVGAGYGGHFIGWLLNRDAGPYNSWGNGSAMRVSAVGYYAQSLQEAMQLAENTASITHNHPEGIKGAEATAAAIYLARTGESKEYIRDFIEWKIGYDLHTRTCDEIRPTYKFNESCQGTVPEAIIAFLESTDYVNAIKLAISLGGDSDTLAAITGGIAHAYYKHIPEDIIAWAMDCLPEDMRKVITAFDEECQVKMT